MQKTRNAVGAIIQRDDTFLLVRKVLMSDSKNGPEPLDPFWGFPQGGMKEGETTLEALIRELSEEIGSSSYTIKTEISERYVFTFEPEVQEKLGFIEQEVTYFLLRFTGDVSELTLPKDGELDAMEFFTYKEMLEKIPFSSFIEYIKRNVPFPK